MTEIIFRCTQQELKNVETFLFYQEYTYKPNFDFIKLIVDDQTEYNYSVFFEKNKYYIITN